MLMKNENCENHLLDTRGAELLWRSAAEQQRNEKGSLITKNSYGFSQLSS